MPSQIPILSFDAQCALCRSFAKLLSKNISTEQLVLKPMDSEQVASAQDFSLETSEGILYGKKAVYWLAEKIPEIKGFFWMLPDSYRTKALIESYDFAKKIRRIFGKACGC